METSVGADGEEQSSKGAGVGIGEQPPQQEPPPQQQQPPKPPKPQREQGERMFYVTIWEGHRAGECNDDPITHRELAEMYMTGSMPGDTLVWEGDSIDGEWVHAKHVFAKGFLAKAGIV